MVSKSKKELLVMKEEEPRQWRRRLLGACTGRGGAARRGRHGQEGLTGPGFEDAKLQGNVPRQSVSYSL